MSEAGRCGSDDGSLWLPNLQSLASHFCFRIPASRRRYNDKVWRGLLGCVETHRLTGGATTICEIADVSVPAKSGSTAAALHIETEEGSSKVLVKLLEKSI